MLCSDTKLASINSKLKHTLELIDQSEAVQIQHISKEGNKEVDSLEM